MMNQTAENVRDLPDLLLVDDDDIYCQVMGQALVNRGFNVRIAHNVDEAVALSEVQAPEYAVVDLNMPGPSGLALVKHLIAIDPHTRIVILTGFSSIATAVTAIKQGAADYLSKPVTAGDVIKALSGESQRTETLEEFSPMSVERMEWEHIQKVLKENDGNISATARSLGMYRRTLQRKLAKKPVAE